MRKLLILLGVGHCLTFVMYGEMLPEEMDFVDDTVLHYGINYGCPAAGIKSTCTGTLL